VTKSGTNALHGDVYEYFRNKVLNAQGFLNTTKPQFNQNQFGGTLGGPIKKDRTFFFGSYEAVVSGRAWLAQWYSCRRLLKCRETSLRADKTQLLLEESIQLALPRQLRLF